MRYTGRWPISHIAAGSGDGAWPPPLTPALAKELEQLPYQRG
jgi:hypothetical protein